LKPRTLQAFETYIRDAEAAMEPTLHENRPFLWSVTNSDTAQQVQQGSIMANSGRARAQSKCRTA